ncbi:MAG: FHA domain-containing protein [Anaerolineales bacterium]|nr:FHA domain-containing protein [Anaerolineales bacterium]
MFQFVMRSGPTPGVAYPLESDQMTIGRDASNGVAINDAEVSRKHAQISFQGGKYVIEDLGSTNGTFVNGQRLSGPVVLKPGDVVSLGEQIVLMYDAVNIDPGATMVAASHKPVRAAQPAPSAPPAYAPPHVAPSYSNAPAKKGGNFIVFIIIGIVLVVCLCVAVFGLVDYTSSWCVFPFNIIAEILRGSGACP